MKVFGFIRFLASAALYLCYSLQFIYTLIGLFGAKREEYSADEELKDYAILICARNEETVIGDLLDSIDRQTYQRKRLSVFVAADDCHDHTAQIAKAKGAAVYERCDRAHAAKGYALDHLLKKIIHDYGNVFEGYLVFDADNVLKEDTVEQFHRMHMAGHEIITGYRNSKNPQMSLTAAANSLWFIRSGVFANGPRDCLGLSSFISGAGFFFDRKVLEHYRGWPFHTLAEDIEFTARLALDGYRVGYCAMAQFYDEQPVSCSQSFRQRLRWAKGYLQVLKVYGCRLAEKAFSGDLFCLDVLLNLIPSFLTPLLFLLETGSLVIAVFQGQLAAWTGHFLLRKLFPSYLMLAALAFVTYIKERSRIAMDLIHGLIGSLFFPVFIYAYIPITLWAIFRKVDWTPIAHNVRMTDIKG